MRGTRFAALLSFVTVVLTALCCVPIALADAPGALDASFGVQGIALTSFGPDTDIASAMAIQPDGRYVVAGSHTTWTPSPTLLSTTHFVTLVRFNADGTLDSTFGSTGRVILDLNDLFSKQFGESTTFRGVDDIAISPVDGRIFIASGIGGDGSSGWVGIHAIACFTPNGTLDTSFGTGGMVKIDIAPWTISNSGQGWNRRLAFTPGGRLIFACTLVTSANCDFVVYCLNGDGTLDLSFGTGGRRLVDITGGSEDNLNWLIADPQGRILVGGSCQNRDTAIARLTSNGALDTTFGGGGRVVTSETVGSIVNAALAPNGSIDAVGGYGSSAYVRRYTDAGALDTAFGSGGKASVPSAGNSDQAKEVAVQPDGSILTVGTKDNGYPTYKDIWVTRLMPSGAADSGFGSNGQVVTDLGGADDCAAAAVDSSGKLVVAGYAFTSGVTSAGAGRSQSTRMTSAVGMGLARYECGPSAVLPGPKTFALKAIVVNRGKRATFSYRVNASTPRVTVKIRIYKGTRLKTTLSVGSVTAGSPHAYRWKCGLAKGKYTWKVLATDARKRTQIRTGANRLTVR